MKPVVAARFSRNGTTSPYGKLDSSIEARIEGYIKDRFNSRAAELGKPAAEFLRDIIRVVALGPDQVKKVHGEHIDIVVGMLGGTPDDR